MEGVLLWQRERENVWPRPGYAFFGGHLMLCVTVVEHKDRLTRFGFRYIETLLAVQGRRIEVVNVSENPIEDLMADLVSIIYSFCSRLYGQRRAKRKTEKIVKELENQKTTVNDNHFDESEKEEVKEKSA